MSELSAKLKERKPYYRNKKINLLDCQENDKCKCNFFQVKPGTPSVSGRTGSGSVGTPSINNKQNYKNIQSKINSGSYLYLNEGFKGVRQWR